MEILFVTGKGGVGKSAVSAALALKKSKESKKVLLVELGDQSFFQDYFKLPQVTYKPTPSGMGFDVALWTGQECLGEYALHLLKVERIYKLFFENTVTRSLINVAPALSELAILGKITSGPPRNVGPKLNYDCLVVDSFASGHFLALLRAPKGLAEAISFGPMGEQSRAILAVLKDSQISKYFVVTLPEELPATEAIELAEGIQKEVGLKPEILLNRTIEMDSAEETGPASEKLATFYKKMKSLKEQQNEWLRFLKKSSFAVFKLPFVFSVTSTDVIRSLEKELPLE